MSVTVVFCLHFTAPMVSRLGVLPDGFAPDGFAPPTTLGVTSSTLKYGLGRSCSRAAAADLSPQS